jgi:hypothetical protein
VGKTVGNNEIGIVMNKAAQLSEKLEKLNVAEGMKLIEKSNEEALYFDVIEDAMCIMHDDGSVNIIENMGNGVMTSEVISAANILKVLHQYRPFKEVFKGNVQ